MEEAGFIWVTILRAVWFELFIWTVDCNWVLWGLQFSSHDSNLRWDIETERVQREATDERHNETTREKKRALYKDLRWARLNYVNTDFVSGRDLKGTQPCQALLLWAGEAAVSGVRILALLGLLLGICVAVNDSEINKRLICFLRYCWG